MSDMPLTIFAFGLDEMRGQILLGIKIAAAVVAFAVGWYLSSPLWRIAYRVVFRHAIPGLPHASLRLLTGGLLGAGAFFFVGFGGGSGWGFGNGGGNGSGNGTGNGTGNDVVHVENKDKTTTPNKRKLPKSREKVEIELLGGALYKGEDKFYLLKRKEPALTLEELEKYLNDHKDGIEVHIILTQHSVSGPPLVKLHETLNKLRILNEEHEEGAKEK